MLCDGGSEPSRRSCVCRLESRRQFRIYLSLYSFFLSFFALCHQVDEAAPRGQNKADVSETTQLRRTSNQLQRDLGALRDRLDRRVKELEEQISSVITEALGAAVSIGPGGSMEGGAGGGGGGESWEELWAALRRKADKEEVEGLATRAEVTLKVRKPQLLSSFSFFVSILQCHHHYHV